MRVLAIDGGGIRGLIPALVLAELERRAGRRVFELFDLIAGTSTGGILACALCGPNPLPAEEVAAIYEEPGPFFFKTRNARERRLEDFPLTVVARATAAAPTYFEPLPVGERALVDGGVFAVNPAMSAFAEVLRFHPSADVVLLSLGTGQRTRSRRFADVDDWGLVEWARPILDVVFDGISDAVDYQLRHVLGDDRYWRLQVELTRASDDLDDATPENLAELRRHAEELIAERSDDLDAVVAAL